jgi:hypothetical protein
VYPVGCAFVVYENLMKEEHEYEINFMKTTPASLTA